MKRPPLPKPLFGHLEGKTIAPRPGGVTIYTTYKCNSRCRNCKCWAVEPSHSDHPQLTIDDYRRLSKDKWMRSMGQISLSGGEPSMHPQIHDIIDAVPPEVVLMIATNAINLKRGKAIVDHLKQRGKAFLMVSIDGIGGTHDATRGVKGNFASVIRLLEYVTSIGLHKVISSTLTSETYQELPQLYALSKQHQAGFHFRVLSPGGYYGSDGVEGEHDRLATMSDEQIDEFEGLILNVVGHELQVNKKPVPGVIAHWAKIPDYLRGTYRPDYCFAGDSMFCLDPYGDIFPCPPYYESMGNLYDFDFDLERLWTAEQARNVRSKVQKLRCGLCWNDCQWPANLNGRPDLSKQFIEEALAKIKVRSKPARAGITVQGRTLDASHFAHLGRGLIVGRNFDLRDPRRTWIGDNVFIGHDVWINVTHDHLKPSDTAVRVRIGDGTVVGNRSFISAADQVFIGNKVLIGQNVHVTDTGHNFDNVHVPMADQGVMRGGRTLVEDNCWLGINSVVNRVCLGTGTIVGANAVVTKDTPPFCVVAGVPARIIKLYDPEAQDFVKVRSDDDVRAIVAKREANPAAMPEAYRTSELRQLYYEPQGATDAAPAKPAFPSKRKSIESRMCNGAIDLDFCGQRFRVPLSNFSGLNFPALHDEALAQLLEIGPDEQVLDIGGGHNPFARANVVVERFIDSGIHRAWQNVPKDKRLVACDGKELPFPDKSFDFIFSRHCLEHVDDPAAVFEEIMRVGKRGFFEVPARWYDYLMGGPTHSWLIDRIGDKIRYSPRPYVESPLQYVLYKPWTEDVEFRARMELYYRNMFFIQVYWEGRFEYEIDTSTPRHYDLADPQIAIRSHLDFAESMVKLGKTAARAEPEFRRVLELDPDNAKAINGLGVLAFQAGKLGQAAQLIAKAAQIAPNDADIQANLQAVRQQIEAAKAQGGEDRWAKMSKSTIPFDKYMAMPYIAKYMDVVKQRWQGGPVLETGLGSGYCAVWMAKHGAKVGGFDLSEGVVEQCKAIAKQANVDADFRIGDLFDEASYKGQVYDVIFHQGVMEHFSDDDIRKIVDIQTRHAKTIVFSVPSDRFPRKVFGDERLLSVDKWKQILEPFDVAEVRCYGDPAWKLDEQEHVLAVVRGVKAKTPAVHAGDSKPITVIWEGPQLLHSSLALVNREICIELNKLDEVELSLRPTPPQEFDAAYDPERLTPLAERFNKPLSRQADAYVRHFWPPLFKRPEVGRWVLMQPWEYGSIPKAWQAPVTNEVDEVWGYTNYVRQVYVDSQVPAHKVHVIPLGVRPELFSPGADPLPLRTKKSFRFLFVGGTIQRKGIDALLRAYTQTFTRADDVCLVIKDFGKDTFYRDSSVSKEIEKLASNPQAPEILFLSDMLAEKDLPRLYASCQCLVHPYRGEGFGLPVAEAMACGLRVVVTRGGACDDFCTDDTVLFVGARRVAVKAQEEFVGQGWMLDPDANELAQRMKQAAADRAGGAEMGMRASAHIRENFTWARSAQRAFERLAAVARA